MGAERAEHEGSEVADRPARAALPTRETDARWLARTVGNRAFGQMIAGRPAAAAALQPRGPGPGARITGKLPAGVDPEQVPVTGLWDWVSGWFSSPATAPNTPAPAAGATPAQPPPPSRPPQSTPPPQAQAPPAPKLSYKTIDAAAGGDCGQFSWAVQWALDRPSPLGGWVVQHVSVERNVKDSAGHDVAGGLNPDWYPMWEAWPVSAGQKVTKYVEVDATDDKDDTYGQGSIPSSTGTVKVIGSAEFYEGLTLPSEFKATNQAPAWILPTTKHSPALPGGTGAIPHTIRATWNCATGSDKRTTATPL